MKKATKRVKLKKKMTNLLHHRALKLKMKAQSIEMSLTCLGEKLANLQAQKEWGHREGLSQDYQKCRI